MNEIYEEYKKENPDEMVGINAIFVRTMRIEAERKKRQEEKLKMVEECRRKYHGEKEGQGRGSKET